MKKLRSAVLVASFSLFAVTGFYWTTYRASDSFRIRLVNAKMPEIALVDEMKRVNLRLHFLNTESEHVDAGEQFQVVLQVDEGSYDVRGLDTQLNYASDDLRLVDFVYLTGTNGIKAYPAVQSYDYWQIIGSQSGSVSLSILSTNRVLYGDLAVFTFMRKTDKETVIELVSNVSSVAVDQKVAVKKTERVVEGQIDTGETTTIYEERVISALGSVGRLIIQSSDKE